MTLFSRLRSILVAIALSTVVTACGESVELLSAIPESEANEILATLLHSGIEAHKIPGKEGMVGIGVDAGEVSTALQVMRANGLPHERFARMGDVFKKEGLVSSPLEERARYVYALSQELAETVSQIDGVITARVHVVLPDRPPGASGAMTPSSAAVFIKYKEAYDLESVVPQVKRLVTNSISNLSYDNVSVVLVPSMAGRDQRPEPTTTTVFSLRVAPESKVDLIVLMVGLGGLALVGLGSAASMYWWWQVRPKRREAGDGAT